MSEPAIRHLLDRKGQYNGGMGHWTICGLPWLPQPEGIVHDCPECVRLMREDWPKSGSHPRLVVPQAPEGHVHDPLR